MTVGPGFSPGLLTPHGNAGARGLVATCLSTVATYRRWGLSPRPEDV